MFSALDKFRALNTEHYKVNIDDIIQTAGTKEFISLTDLEALIRKAITDEIINHRVNVELASFVDKVYSTPELNEYLTKED